MLGPAQNQPQVEEQKIQHRFVSLNLKNCGFYGIRPKWLNGVRPYPVPEGKSDKDEILPMKKVQTKCNILGALATLDVELHYTNPSDENPVEAIYEFPLDK